MSHIFTKSLVCFENSVFDIYLYSKVHFSWLNVHSSLCTSYAPRFWLLLEKFHASPDKSISPIPLWQQHSICWQFRSCASDTNTQHLDMLMSGTAQHSVVADVIIVSLSYLILQFSFYLLSECYHCIFVLSHITVYFLPSIRMMDEHSAAAFSTYMSLFYLQLYFFLTSLVSKIFIRSCF